MMLRSLRTCGICLLALCAIRFAVGEIEGQSKAIRFGVLQTGNVFGGSEHIRFRVDCASKSCNWILRDVDNSALASGTLDGSLFDLRPQPPGYYTVSFRTADDEVSGERNRISFAVLQKYATEYSPSSIFAVNTHGSRLTSELLEQTIQLARTAGIEDVRDDDCYWSEIERQRGRYVFSSSHDQVVDAAKSAGIHPLLMLGFGNSNYDQGETPYSNTGYLAFSRYAAATVQHFGNRVPALEVWNEYYGGFSSGPCKQSPDCYAQMLKVTYSEVKRVSPKTLVVGPSAFKVPLDWFEAFFKAGGLAYLDIVSIHPYRSPGEPEGLAEDIGRLRQLIARYNKNRPKPIWITEQGWTTELGKIAGVDEQTQAAYAVRSAIVSQAAGVAKTFWYDLLDDGDDRTDSEQMFGLLRRPDSKIDGITPKPSFVAYSTAAYMLRGSQLEAAEPINDTDVLCYRFHSASGLLRVIWTRGDTYKAIRVRTDKALRSTDAFGRKRTVTPIDGKIELRAGALPFYLEGEIDGVTSERDAVVTQPSAGVTAKVYPAIDAKGANYTERLMVELTNHDPHTAVQVSAVDWAYGSQSGTLSLKRAVAPLSAEVVAIPLRKVPFFQASASWIEARLTDGSSIGATGNWGFNPIVYGHPKMTDGELLGLDQAPVIPLNPSSTFSGDGADSLSGHAWLMWDEKALYVAAEAAEPRYVIQPNPFWLQAGDSLGVGLQPGMPGDGLSHWGAKWLSLAAGMTGQGPMVFAESERYGLLRAVSVEVHRDERLKATRYLLTLPWQTIAPISPSTLLFSAALTLNKNDGKTKTGYFSLGLAGWVGWADGLNNFRLAKYQPVIPVR